MTGWQALSVAIVGVSDLVATPIAASGNESLIPLLGTTYTDSVPMFSNGKLTGCTIEFGALARDWVYAPGTFFLVQGSFGFATSKGSLGSLLKVVIEDVDVSGGGVTANAPTRAYLVALDLSTNIESVVDAQASDTPGGLFVIAAPDPAFDIVTEGLGSGKIVIAFNKGVGETDIQLELDLTVLKTQPDGSRVSGRGTILEFSKCMATVLDGLL